MLRRAMPLRQRRPAIPPPSSHQSHRRRILVRPGVEPGGPDARSSIAAPSPRTPFDLRQRATARPRRRHFCITHLPDPSLAKVSPGSLFLFAHAPVVCRSPRWPVSGRRHCAATAPWPGFVLPCTLALHNPRKWLPLPCACSTTLLLANLSPKEAQRVHAGEIYHAELPLPSHLSSEPPQTLLRPQIDHV